MASESLTEHLPELERFRSLMEDMTQSVSSARESLKPLLSQLRDTSDLDTTAGISLLTLKNHLLLSYMQSLLLLSSHKLLGHTLQSRSPPSKPFSAPNRGSRGEEAGDLVDSLVEGRIALEKVKTLEGRMKYQIDKLVRGAAERGDLGKNMEDDPLSFRPNPANFGGAGSDDGAESAEDDGLVNGRSKVYQPPRVAPVPYTEGPKSRKTRAAPIPSALSSLTTYDLAQPHMESTTGLGNMPSLSSKRAQEIQRMTRFEEENMTRLVMNKKEDKRRRLDEADISLGGGGIRGRGRRAGGFEAEFEDVLRAVGTVGRPGVRTDGYEALRQKGRREGVLERSRKRPVEDMDGPAEGGRQERKKGRFVSELKAQKKRVARKAK